MTHLDIFSGIGGFALAARWNGIETVQFVEIDERCRNFLSRAWPGVPIHDDVRTFHYDGGPVFLMSGGVPCQPASRAGKQRGKEDNRWLWPEAVRVLGEVKPTWAIFENPPGIGDVGLAGILSDVEAQGYEVRVFGVPACAIGAPHIRERYWIVAHCNDQGRERWGGLAESAQERRAATGWRHDAPGPVKSLLADAERNGELRTGRAETEQNRNGENYRLSDGGDAGWGKFVWLPCADGKVRRAPDDSFGLVDGLHRSVLGALGNSIVPQVAAEIIGAIVETERSVK